MIGDAIGFDEVCVGMVANLDQALLEQDPRNVKTKRISGELKARPFVCVEVNGACSTWAPLTTVERPERLEILPEWRSGDWPAPLALSVFLNDGANLYIGPTDAFVSASCNEKTVRGRRAMLASDGVAAIRFEIERQEWRRDAPQFAA